MRNMSVQKATATVLVGVDNGRAGLDWQVIIANFVCRASLL